VQDSITVYASPLALHPRTLLFSQYVVPALHTTGTHRAATHTCPDAAQSAFVVIVSPSAEHSMTFSAKGSQAVTEAVQN
jgi:hypothetical protein